MPELRSKIDFYSTPSQDDATFVVCRSWPNPSPLIRSLLPADCCRFASRNNRPAQISGNGFHRYGSRRTITNVSRNPKPYMAFIFRSGLTIRTPPPTTKGSAASTTTKRKLITNMTRKETRCSARDRSDTHVGILLQAQLRVLRRCFDSGTLSLASNRLAALEPWDLPD